ncbi:MAG: LytR family transcriptional regulator, partial [Eubacterium sp.]|nr:LytR family transcriptional regulator [Eubacterium sp.]
MSKKQLSPVKRRRRKKLIVFIIEIIVFLVLLALVWGFLKLNKIKRTEIDEDNLGVSEEIDSELVSGYTNIALFGLDNRTMGNLDSGNADVIMVLSVDNESKEMNLVS